MDIEIAIQNFFQAPELKEILKNFYETDKNVQELWIDKIVEHIKNALYMT